MIAELHLLVTLGLGAMFVIASASKLAAPSTFRSTVARYRLVPPAAIRPLAAVLPVFELALGAALLSGYAVAAALVGAAALLTLFAGAMILVMRSGRRPACGCGFGRGRPVSWQLVGRNAALAALGVWASTRSPAGLRELAADSGPYSAGNAIAALLTLVLALVGVQLAARAGRVLTAVLAARQ